MGDEIGELLAFLGPDTRADVRSTALDIVKGLTVAEVRTCMRSNATLMWGGALSSTTDSSLCNSPRNGLHNFASSVASHFLPPPDSWGAKPTAT